MTKPKTESRFNLCSTKIKSFVFMTVEGHKVIRLVTSLLLVPTCLVSAYISFQFTPVETGLKFSNIFIYQYCTNSPLEPLMNDIPFSL